LRSEISNNKSFEGRNIRFGNKVGNKL